MCNYIYDTENKKPKLSTETREFDGENERVVFGYGRLVMKTAPSMNHLRKKKTFPAFTAPQSGIRIPEAPTRGTLCTAALRP